MPRKKAISGKSGSKSTTKSRVLRRPSLKKSTVKKAAPTKKAKASNSSNATSDDSAAISSELSSLPIDPKNRPDFESMNWIPVRTLSNLGVKESITVVLPFSGVAVEDVPDVLKCFGGTSQIVSNLTNPRENQRKLTFDLCPDPVASHAFSRPLTLARSSPANNFVLRLELQDVVESASERRERGKRELSAVERHLGAVVKPLPPRIVGATMTHRTTAMFEFDQLYDFRVCSNAPKDKSSYKPKQVELISMLPYIRPTFPMSETASDPRAELYFPALRFTNQTSFSGLDCVASMYTTPISVQDKAVLSRARRAYAQTIRWPSDGSPNIPMQAAEQASKNLHERVSEAIIQQAEQLFVLQPIWSRQEFYEQLEKDRPDLVKEHCRFILPGMAFRFSNGPWTRSWCRFGYNPATVPASRRYQVLDFRINQAIIAKRRTVSKKAPPTELNLAMRSLMEKLADAQNPRGYQFLIQLIRLENVPSVREILTDRQQMSNKCDPKEGFFVPGTMEKLRLEVTNTIAKQDPGLEHLRRVVKSLQEIGLYDKVVVPKLRLGFGDSDDEGNDDGAQE